MSIQVFEALADAQLLAYTAESMPAAPYLEHMAAHNLEIADKLSLIRMGIERAYERRDLALLMLFLSHHRKLAQLAVTAALLSAAEAGEPLDFPGIDIEKWTGLRLESA